MEKFKPGDLVRLRSGGPIMTVATIDDGEVNCSWFRLIGTDIESGPLYDESGPYSNRFEPHLLALIDPSTGLAKTMRLKKE